MSDLIIVFLGPPGCGKGTQAKIFGEKLRLAHVSTGDLFRREIASESALGLSIKGLLDKGHLVSDDYVFKSIEARLNRKSSSSVLEMGIIFDGFPRAVSQAEWFKAFLIKRWEKLSAVIYLDLTVAELQKRLAFRRASENRNDDSEEVQLERLRVYNEVTQPLVDYYANEGLLEKVDASGPVDLVTANIEAALELRGVSRKLPG